MFGYAFIVFHGMQSPFAPASRNVNAVESCDGLSLPGWS